MPPLMELVVVSSLLFLTAAAASDTCEDGASASFSWVCGAKHVVVPDGIQDIPKDAFKGCETLELQRCERRQGAST